MKKRKRLFVGLLSISLILCSCGVGKDGTSGNSGTSQNENNSEEHSHSYSSQWSYDDTYHWHKCIGCNEIKDKSEHIFNEWIIDTQPTEESMGRKHHVCNICKYAVYEDIEKLDHVHDWEEPSYSWKYDYSTCSARRKCKINRYHFEEETVNSTYEVISNPTTESTGVGRYTAVFTNSAFEQQTHDIVLPKLDVSVNGVSLYPSTLSLSIGDTSILVESISPANATNKNVSWKSSDSNIATVSNNGLVTAIKKGNATITVTTEDGGFTATCEVEVKNISVTGISLSTSTLSIEEEKTSRLYAYVEPTHATNKNVTWSSDDSSIASVDQSGLITAIKKGTTAIKATTEDGNFVASCAVEVLEKENFSYFVGDTVVENYDYVTSYSTTHEIKVYTPITNNGNVNIYISSCTIDIEDSDGNLKQSLSYVSAKPNIIKPGETTYLYDEKTYEGDVFTGLVGIPHPTIKNAKSANGTRYDVNDISFSPDSIYGIKATGKMTNTSSNKTSMPYIAINLFDASDKYYSTLYTIITDDVEAGESISFTASSTNLMYHKDFTIADIGRYETFAYEYDFVI